MAVDTSQVTINDGLATNTDICRLFDLTNKTVSKKLATLQPVVRKGAYTYYRLSEVLPLLVKPKNVEEYIKTMTFLDLDKSLSKEFWAGQRSKQIYEREAGLLWSTDEVLERVGTSFKTVVMEIKLLSDSLKRTTGLSDDQKRVLEELLDGTLKSIQVKLLTEFKPKPKLPAPEGAAVTPDYDLDEDDDEL